MSGYSNLRDFRAGARRILEKRSVNIITTPEERARTATALQFVVPSKWTKDRRDGFEAGLALACKVAVDFAARLGQLGKPNLEAMGIADILHEAMELAGKQSEAIDMAAAAKAEP